MSDVETEGDEVSDVTDETETNITTETTDSDFTTETSETSERFIHETTYETTDEESFDAFTATTQSHSEEEQSTVHAHPEDMRNEDGRHIKVNDYKWGMPPVLPLADIIVESACDIESSQLENFLNNATHEQKLRILELIPLHLPPEITVPIIDDGIYWKRLCLRSWPSWDVWRYSNNWKCMFIHRSVQELIENFIPDKHNINSLCKKIETYSQYIISLKICKLTKIAPVEVEIDVHSDYFEQQLDDIVSAKQKHCYVNFEKVFACFPHLRSLTFALSPSCIDLEDFHINNVDFNCFLKGIEQLKELESFRVSNGNFSNNQLTRILPVIFTHKALRDLNLSFNFIDDSTCYAISKILISNSILKSLTLMYNKITDGGAKIIASALYSDSNLKSLDLSLNMIGDIGASIIANVLLKNTYLTELDMSKNKFTEEGGIAFVELLKKSRTLRSLKLQENFLGEKVGKQFADAIKENDYLLELEVRFCGFRNEDEGLIHQAILQNRSKIPYTNNKDNAASEFLF